MSNLDVGTLIAFVLIVLFSGMAFSRSGSSMKSFFAAGGNVSWIVSGLSLFMSFFSVGTFVVWGSIAYEKGIVALTIQFCICIAGFIAGIWIAPRWNKLGFLTVAEFVGERLGPNIKKAYSVTFLFISLFTAGAFLYPVGKIIEISTGIPLNAAILILGLLIIIYTAVGGLWAVLVTDVLQFVVLSIGVLILVPLAFSEIGGVLEFSRLAPDGFFTLVDDEYSLLFMVAFALYNLVFIGGNWAYVQRYTSVGTSRDARKVGLLFGGLYLFSPLIWMLPPMIYRTIQPDLNATNSEDAYLLMANLVLPSGLIGLIVGGMVFATASSVNTALNISSGVFTNDLYRYFRQPSNEHELMLVARLATVMFGVFSIVVALSVESLGGIVSVVLGLAAMTGGALYIPILWSIFSRYINGISILWVSLSTLALNLFFKLGLGQTIGIESLNRSTEMLLGILYPVVLMIILELVFRKISADAPSIPISVAIHDTSETDLDSDSNKHKYSQTVISLAILAIGFLVFFLGLVSDTGKIITSILGATVTLGAIAFILKNRLITQLQRGAKS